MLGQEALSIAGCVTGADEWTGSRALCLIRFVSLPKLLGHRGAPRICRENTLESFEAALRAGLDGVELDIQRSLDGVLVVHHNEHLSDGRLIAALNWSELRSTPLGGGHMPSLEEVMVWALERDAFLNIEIKSSRWGGPSDGREAELVRLLGRFKLEQLVVSSFDPLALMRVRWFNPRVRTGLLLAPKAGPAWLARLAWPLGVRAVHLQYELVTFERLEHEHRAGRSVYAWTVNTLSEAKRLLELGVDGLIGDDPEILLEARRQLGLFVDAPSS